MRDPDEQGCTRVVAHGHVQDEQRDVSAMAGNGLLFLRSQIRNSQCTCSSPVNRIIYIKTDVFNWQEVLPMVFVMFLTLASDDLSPI